MKRRAWKIVLGVVGAMVLFIALLVGDAYRRAGLSLDHHRAELDKQIAQFRARDHRRPSVYADSTDGNAWDHYASALKALGALPDDIANLVPEIQGITDDGEEPSPDDHAMHTLFKGHASIFAAFEAGARCRSVDLPFKSVDTVYDSLVFQESMRAGKFLAGFIRHAHRMGRPAEVLTHGVTALAFVQDYGRCGFLMGSLVQFTMDHQLAWAFRDVFADHSFSAADLESFAAALDRLEQSRPDFTEALVFESAFARSALLNLEWKDFASGWTGLNSVPKPPRPPWRCLFSQRITRAQALSLIPDLQPDLPRLRSLASWQRMAATAPRKLQPPYSENPLVERVVPYLGRSFESDAVSQMMKTLLRVGVAVAWFEARQGRLPGKLEDLVPQYLSQVPVCPLNGQPLRYKDGKIWSLGKNGVDDGGTPGQDDAFDAEDGDVVWTVKRR